ncbi:hypothetical protein CONLIGDRAFT_634134 [Coniochaeta ligniaria NRRL 30616]|uniref:Uncharacterized protein n=1 Tax=Coniochaeta ligniaria NRRL 30616 TaxID=1408157 RepID=A0A1J7J3D8_9PEZI|nr:hypothetical protein CONLIGDRAFT_634134 [Coniochaeta ligniaria NRRL 30616]
MWWLGFALLEKHDTGGAGLMGRAGEEGTEEAGRGDGITLAQSTSCAATRCRVEATLLLGALVVQCVGVAAVCRVTDAAGEKTCLGTGQ